MKKSKRNEAKELAVLKKIYEKAKKQGIYIREFAPGRRQLAVAGGIKEVEEYEENVRQVVDVARLSLLECATLGAESGIGLTRVAACRAAIRAFKKHGWRTSRKK